MPLLIEVLYSEYDLLSDPLPGGAAGEGAAVQGGPGPLGSDQAAAEVITTPSIVCCMMTIPPHCRSHRPGTELCLDTPHSALVAEVASINGKTVDQLLHIIPKPCPMLALTG